MLRTPVVGEQASGVSTGLLPLSEAMTTYVIAEAGSCHEGCIDSALSLIRAAALAGANAVKFQWTSNPEKMGQRRSIPHGAESYARLAFPVCWHEELRHSAASYGLDYLCTVFLPEDIWVVAPYVEKFKIASLENQDVAFQRAHVEFHKPILVSCGLDGRSGHLHGDAKVYWLHCVSAYPCPENEANIARLRSGHYDGLSDHTTSLLSGALAVACGAQIIEKHLRLDSTSHDNPDYPHSMSPSDFTEYVHRIRNADILLGDGIKRIMPAEIPLLPHVVR